MSETSTSNVLSRLKHINKPFLFTVLLPTALAIIYYGLIASDIYISESRFIVRSQRGPTTTSLLGSLFQGSGSSTSTGGLSLSAMQSDANTVHDYIRSRDALAELEKTLDVKKAFTSGGLDVINKYPGLGNWLKDGFEALYRYYPKRVTVEQDSKTSVSVLTVSAFSAEDAQHINEALLKMSERLVNQLNDRARKDTIGYAAAEVKEAEKRAKDAAVALANFRDRKAVIDPEKQSAIQLQQIAKLYEELVIAKAQLAQLTNYTPNNPQIPAVKTRIDVLQKEIDSETAKVAGGGGSLAYKQSEYERLALERTFAERQLAAAMTALEAARNEAQRQQLYLDRISQPNLPDAAIEPRRLRSILVVFVLGLVVWGLSSLLMASVREHLD